MRTYPSKLLLFGEHILLLGGTALATPLPAYHGKWVEQGGQPDAGLHGHLLQFAASECLQRMEDLDVAAFRRDLQNGLMFSSNIPMGYGLGSSGALCAAVYDRYGRNKTADLARLKVVFAHMESFFHGSSSGIDPLVSYVQKPLMIRHKTDVSAVAMSVWERPPVVFLIDSALPRQTGPLVRWFLESSTQADFAAALQSEYVPAHEAVVEGWVNADAAAFWPNLHRISLFQFEYFKPMVPASLREIWIDSMHNQDFTLKICGAGGGGYALGFSHSRAPVMSLAKNFNLIFPFTEPA